ncbi:MAG TPA: nicotinamidase [Ktedonobacterales bacterium]|nr:nicotinamidase [Ktedonobacterales bacterium]
MADALIVVDVQNDFCSGGSLAVPDGDAVVPIMNEYIARATDAGIPIFASRDWHPPVTRHFVAQGGEWPPHCVQGTHGAEFHPDLRLPPDTVIVSAGTGPEDEGYSAFDGELPGGQPLADAMRARGVEHVYVGGLATDYCVRMTVLDALKHGFAASLLADASRAVDVKPGDGERATNEMLAAGAELRNLDEVAPTK